MVIRRGLEDPQPYVKLLLQCVDRPCGWYKKAHLQNLEMRGKWKGRYGEALLFDLLRVCPMFLREADDDDQDEARSPASLKAWRVFELVRALVWGCFGRVWYAKTVEQRHLVREHFKYVWAELATLIGHDKGMAWMWDPNAKNLENFFLCSIVVTTDLQLNDGAIIELMHILFKKVPHCSPPSPSQHPTGVAPGLLPAGEPAGVRPRPARAGRAGEQRAPRGRQAGGRRPDPHHGGAPRPVPRQRPHPEAPARPAGERGRRRAARRRAAAPPRVGVHPPPLLRQAWVVAPLPRPRGTPRRGPHPAGVVALPALPMAPSTGAHPRRGWAGSALAGHLQPVAAVPLLRAHAAAGRQGPRDHRHPPGVRQVHRGV